jgi:Flp pilus assembly protein TadB
MTVLIPLISILAFALMIYLTLELVPAAPTGRLAETLTPANGTPLSGWRKSLSPLDKPVSKWTPAGWMRRTRADLYWAQVGDKWSDWNEIQFTSLRLAAGIAGFVVGSVVFAEPTLAIAVALLGFQYPVIAMGGVARRTRRQFVAQLPEYVQLVSAQMSANVSMEEALRRTSQSQSLAGKWMRKVLQMAQGRDLVEQMQREAQESQLPELVGMAVQLEFIRRGTAQQELMGQLATSIAADYIGNAEQRAEKIGSELVIPMVIFYFLPFMVTLLIVIGWPIAQNLGGLGG